MQRPIGWYIKRIRSMRPLELVHRVQEVRAVRRLKSAYHSGANVLAAIPNSNDVEFCQSTTACLATLPWQTPDRSKHHALLAGEWHALGYHWAWRKEELVWNDAPDTGNQWPADFFGSVTYSEGNPVGDVRVAWEPARLQQLIALALVAQHSDDATARQAVILIEDQLLSFVTANPYLHGIHYISVMECAQRVMAVCHALDMVRDKLTRADEIWSSLLIMIQGHATLISQRMSLHSSAGNHTVAEAAGLIYAGVLFPELENAQTWRETGAQILDNEAARQILPDGGSEEQAFHYLLLVVDIMGLTQKLFEHKNLDCPANIAAAFERGTQYLNTFASGFENLPTIGDSDSGFAISQFLRLAWQQQETGDLAPHNFDALSFIDAGYTLVNANIEHDQNSSTASAVNQRSDLRLVFDHGTFGMAPLYGHGHADALSLILRLGDQDVLIDPGTYTYSGHPEWRRYFRGTRAHNTVTVDHLDQATQELSFMWSNTHAAELVYRTQLGDRGLLIVAKHEGYRHCGVSHWRGIVFNSPREILIVDALNGSGEHDLEVNWHSAVKPSQRDDMLDINTNSGSMTLAIDGGETTVYSASNDPKLGWNAPVYGEKVPAHTISTRWRGALPHRFITRLTIDTAAVESEQQDGEQYDSLFDTLSDVMTQLMENSNERVD